MRAEERLAAFLLNLSQRFEARGYSPTEFMLRMTREEIGSYLGLKLETVSRVLSRFAQDGLIDVKQKHIRIVDPDGLRQDRLWPGHLGRRHFRLPGDKSSAPLERHRLDIRRAFPLRAASGRSSAGQLASIDLEWRAREEHGERARYRAHRPQREESSV